MSLDPAKIERALALVAQDLDRARILKAPFFGGRVYIESEYVDACGDFDVARERVDLLARAVRTGSEIDLDAACRLDIGSTLVERNLARSRSGIR